MKMQWKCPDCGTVLQKPDYWNDLQKEAIYGTVRCGGCNATYSAGDIAMGRFDVGRTIGSFDHIYSYANFWQRCLAWIIDQAIIIIVIVILGKSMARSSAGVEAETLQALALIISWLYYAIQESSKQQATFGKRIVSIKVTGLEGQKISFGKATGRFFAKLLSSLIFGLGFLMALWSEKKQTLHDQLADTLVILK